MDLRSRSLRRGAVGAASLACAACAADTPLEYGDDAIRLPATLYEALPLARAQAEAEASGAHVTRLGGGFTVMDAAGRARNHSFIFHARAGQSAEKITVHLVHGSPWVFRERVALADMPRPFAPEVLALDSDGVVDRAIRLAPDTLDTPEAYAARLSAVPSWPEPTGPGGVGDRIAWRVDFLVLDRLQDDRPPVHFSTARFYFDPTTGDLLGLVVPETGRELYPFP